MSVIDVSEADFQAEVLDRSANIPVVVDFWAEWCAPCRQLGPVLEQAAAAREGKVVLAKVDTDANPNISASFGIQGIPAVKAFQDGRVTAEFTGAKPPREVERFFNGLVPSEVDQLIAAGDEASLRRASELEPTRSQAVVPLAGLLRARGEHDDALALLGNLAGDFRADGLKARIAIEQEGEAHESAFAALDAGETERALDELIEAMPAAGEDEKERLRQIVVAALDELGVEHPLARDARRRLASALY